MKLVPEGHSKIAQRFSVGLWRLEHSPEGTAETAVTSLIRHHESVGLTSLEARLSRRFATYVLERTNPRLKPWAILKCPSGTELEPFTTSTKGEDTKPVPLHP